MLQENTNEEPLKAEIEKAKLQNIELNVKVQELQSNLRKNEFIIENIRTSLEESERKRGELESLLQEKESSIIILSRKVNSLFMVEF